MQLQTLSIWRPRAKATFYASGSVSPLPVYADPLLSVALPNPVVADGAGQFPAIFADPGLIYDVKIEPPVGPQLAFLSAIRAIGAPAQTREDSILDLQARTWPEGRPEQIQLDELYYPADGGGKFLWSPTSTAAEERSLIVKETAEATGRWLRRNNAPVGPSVITLEDLHEPDDDNNYTVAFERAAQKIVQGYHVIGLGRYKVDPDRVVFNADRNALWESSNGPRVGSLFVPGVVECTNNSVGPRVLFNLIGNQGGASAIKLEISHLIGPGIENNDPSVAIRMQYSGFDVRIGEVTDFHHTTR